MNEQEPRPEQPLGHQIATTSRDVTEDILFAAETVVEAADRASTRGQLVTPVGVRLAIDYLRGALAAESENGVSLEEM